jgi:integrase
MKLIDLNLARIEQFYTQLLRRGDGPRTVRHTHSVLHRALERAVRYDLIARNPAKGATLPKYSPPEMKVLDESQVNQLLMAARESPYEALYHLAIITGMRQGELYGLKWEDLHWHTGELHVRRQAVQTSGGGWAFAELKTRFGTRIVKLGEATLQVLRRHQQRQKTQIALAGDRWQDNELIFPSAVGTPLHKSNMRKDFNRVLEKAGLTPHPLPRPAPHGCLADDEPPGSHPGCIPAVGSLQAQRYPGYLQPSLPGVAKRCCATAG